MLRFTRKTRTFFFLPVVIAALLSDRNVRADTTLCSFDPKAPSTNKLSQWIAGNPGTPKIFCSSDSTSWMSNSIPNNGGSSHEGSLVWHAARLQGAEINDALTKAGYTIVEPVHPVGLEYTDIPLEPLNAIRAKEKCGKFGSVLYLCAVVKENAPVIEMAQSPVTSFEKKVKRAPKPARHDSTEKSVGDPQAAANPASGAR